MSDADIKQLLVDMSKRLTSIETRLTNIENSTTNMDNHISFVQTVYDTVQIPLNSMISWFELPRLDKTQSPLTIGPSVPLLLKSDRE
jgi:hypothetical protein